MKASSISKMLCKEKYTDSSKCANALPDLSCIELCWMGFLSLSLLTFVCVGRYFHLLQKRLNKLMESYSLFSSVKFSLF